MSNEANNTNSSKIFKGKSLAVTIATVLLFAAVLTFAIYEGTKNTIAVTANGEQEEVRTHAETVGAFLEEQEIEAGEHDFLSHSKETPINEDLALEWDAAEQYNLTVDGKATSAWTTENTVSEILAKANVELTKHDKVSPALDEQVDEETTIAVEKAYEVTIQDGLSLIHI